MTPFQVFRLWCRRAPTFQKAMSATAALAVLAVLVWAVVPAGSRSTSGFGSFGTSGPNGKSQRGAGTATQVSTGTTAGGSSTVVATAGGQGGVSTSAAGSAGAATGAGAGTASASGHCVSPPGSAQGVSATQIKIAVIIVNLAGPAADSTFGIASPADQQAAFQAVVNDINANGGVACRKLVPQFFDGNPVDQSGLQQLCLTISQAGVYAVMDPGAYANYAAGLTCYAQNHLPYFEGYDLSEQQIQQLYPYMFSFNTLDNAYKDSVFGLKEEGFFSPSNGFKKLGIIYRDCYPELFPDEISWLNQAGVASAQISSYNMGCPQVFASPSDVENAIIQFKEAGVTNMTEVFELGDMPTFTDTAQSQGFDPKWGIGDDGELEIAGGTEAPNNSNMNGALAIAASRDGEENTPSLAASPTAGTQKCNAIMSTVGLSPVYNQAAAIGNACDQLWMFEDAVDNAPSISPAALVDGLERTGSIDFSYPQGPNNFTAAGTTYGGQFWRVDQYYSSCSCWRVIEPNWNPSF